MTSAMKVRALPTAAVPNWSAVCDRLDKGEEPAYDMTKAEVRTLNAWALRNRGYAVYYRKVEDAFKLSKQRQSNRGRKPA